MNQDDFIEQLDDVGFSYLFEMNSFISNIKDLLKPEKLNEYENYTFKLKKLTYLEPALWTFDRENKY